MILSHPIQASSSAIFLRSLLPTEDVTPTYQAWLNDYDVSQYMETRHRKWGLNDIRDFVTSMNQSSDQLLLGIFTQDKQQHIGNIKLGPINTIHKNACLSLFIGEKDFWGKGIAFQAISLLSGYAFNNLGLEKLSAGMYAQNISSLKAFLRAGFCLEGILKDHSLLDKNKRTDLFQVGLIRKNYLNSELIEHTL